ncbi:biotin--[acetyl-CoA-carboxylase] ligase [Aestuariimicrobium kwangyangense]|uniref:biotin--[acetyl-CoA-carboxylase] ligase n=1 Tax=Aestuariimicrobium kwangyangense TaxID=396389 RepID=UPI0003B2E779|nr:biotin--[acetyl-CoA-carboxylase] ligase [Aestuariimicrobium kwangyangense]
MIELAEALRGTRWRRVEVLDSTGSTNADAAVLAAAGEPDGAVVVALHQTAGRGRFDRRWEAPPGAAVATSAVVRTDRPMVDWTWLPLVTGVAVLRGIRAVAPGCELELKWPNDVLVAGGDAPGKVCGILCERHEGLSTAPGAAAVIGFGINTSLTREQLPVPTATSLALAGFDVEPLTVVASVLRELDDLLAVWQERGHLREAYTAACGSIGQNLRVQVSDTEQVSGVGDSIDPAGRLVVRTADGLRAFSAGDVVHLRRG